jgi:hypothetical protein
MCVVHTEAFPPANIWSICCIISCWAGFVPALGEEAGFSGATLPPTDRGVVGIPPGNPPTSPPGRPPGSPPGAEAAEGRTAHNNGWNRAFAVFDTILLQPLPRAHPPQLRCHDLLWGVCVYIYIHKCVCVYISVCVPGHESRCFCLQRL